MKAQPTPTRPNGALRLNLVRDQRDRLAKVAGQLHCLLEPSDKPDGRAFQIIAQVLSTRIGELAPDLAAALANARSGSIDALYVTGLPRAPAVVPLVLLAITYLLGKPFNYATQNLGRLVMELKPDRNSREANTNTTAAEFGWHSDDAAVPRDCRAAWINLYGLINPPGTTTSYVAIAPVIESMSADVVSCLFEPRFRVRVPLSFRLGNDIWSEPRPILSLSPYGAVEVAWPSYATVVADPTDVAGERALAALLAALPKFAEHVPVDPGTLLAFSNLRGLHMRSAIGDQDRLILRTYAAESLDALRARTGMLGPVFDITGVIFNDN